MQFFKLSVKPLWDCQQLTEVGISWAHSFLPGCLQKLQETAVLLLSAMKSYSVFLRGIVAISFTKVELPGEPFFI